MEIEGIRNCVSSSDPNGIELVGMDYCRINKLPNIRFCRCREINFTVVTADIPDEISMR